MSNTSVPSGQVIQKLRSPIKLCSMFAVMSSMSSQSSSTWSVSKKSMNSSDVNATPVASGKSANSDTPTGGKAVQVMLCTGFPFKNPGASSQSGVETSVLKMGIVDTSTWCGKRLVLLQLFTSCTTKVTMYSPGSL